MFNRVSSHATQKTFHFLSFDSLNTTASQTSLVLNCWFKNGRLVNYKNWAKIRQINFLKSSAF